ncbi:hypothetical protein MKX07_006006 [Trichoderma sp. CBMAI-0711]|nr:hypothetical protein MKX07_006006 [Trichoderma sp. CBMAI-0711]
MSAPLFWSTPLKYCSWAARERPAFFWSVVVGAAGPLLMPIVPPIRHMLGDIDPAPIPVTYPGTFKRNNLPPHAVLRIVNRAAAQTMCNCVGISGMAMQG